MKKERLGGWLLFIYVALIISLPGLIYDIITGFPIKNLSIIANIIVFAVSLNLVIGIHKRSKEIRKLADYYFIGFAISAIINSFVYSNFTIIIAAIVGIAIWRNYFYKMPRIKKTFGIK